MNQLQMLDGRYQIVRQLSSGGFGFTYLARDTRRPGEPFCVAKELRHEHQGNPKILRLFQQEAEMLERLGRHDQIPQLLASFNHNSKLYLIQEYVEGDTLADELQDSSGQKLKKNESEVIALLGDVLAALAVVHKHKVVHRDIKPANLIRRKQDGKIVLIDFGAVKALTHSQVQSNGQITATVSIGSPGYSPHEQISQGNPRPASDIYALGMTAIEALTGVYPTALWTDPNTAEVMWSDRAQVSPQLENILTQMVHYHFSRRFQDAEAALVALQNVTERRAPAPAPVIPILPPTELSHSTPVSTDVANSGVAVKPRRDVLKFLGFLGAGAIAALGSQQLLQGSQNSDESSETSATASDTPTTSPDDPIETDPPFRENPPTSKPTAENDLTAGLPRLFNQATVAMTINDQTVTMEIDGRNTPYTSGNFIDLVKKGIYNGTTFHRVVTEPQPFVAQGGDPRSADPTIPTAQLGTGHYINPETNQPRFIPLEIRAEGEKRPVYGKTLTEANIQAAPILKHRRGAVAMARAGVNSASAQFYIALADIFFLDGDYAVFGYVTSGMDIVDNIQIGDVITAITVTSNETFLLQ